MQAIRKSLFKGCAKIDCKLLILEGTLRKDYATLHLNRSIFVT